MRLERLENGFSFHGDRGNTLLFTHEQMQQGDWTLTQLPSGTLCLHNELLDMSLLWLSDATEPTGILWGDTDLFSMDGEHQDEFRTLNHSTCPMWSEDGENWHDQWFEDLSKFLCLMPLTSSSR